MMLGIPLEGHKPGDILDQDEKQITVKYRKPRNQVCTPPANQHSGFEE
jgi:hypothetical protein